jgi:hypothetical protein
MTIRNALYYKCNIIQTHQDVLSLGQEYLQEIFTLHVWMNHFIATAAIGASERINGLFRYRWFLKGDNTLDG